MAMGSPLSGILSNNFLEHLEANYFKQVINKDIVWLRYVDYVLVIAPRRLDLDSLRGRLNSVEPSIQFTIEYENNDRLPFLDVLLVKENNNLKFNVFRKATNKNVFVHFYSNTDKRAKLGINIGFYLRALRICSAEFLEYEFDIIFHNFLELKYPPFVYS